MNGSPAFERTRSLAIAGLAVMIVWTLVVKYLVPVLWFVAERAAGRPPEAVPVMWDLWPLAHAALAWALWRRTAWAWRFGVAVSALEVAVVATKFALFLDAPTWTFWRLLWFTNKVYVLAFFVLLLAALLRGGRAVLEPAGEATA